MMKQAPVRSQGHAVGVLHLEVEGRERAAQFLDDRADGQYDRLLADVEGGLLPPRAGEEGIPDTTALARLLRDRQSEKATPLYDEARSAGPLEDVGILRMLMNVPAFRDAHRRALGDLARVGKQKPPLFDEESGALVRVPTIDDIDLIKKGLDGELYNQKRGRVEPANALDAYGMGLLEDAQKSLVAAADELVPKYKEARATFAGEIRLQDALELGQGVLQTDSREIARLVSEMAESEKAHFRLGVADALRRAMAGRTDTGVKPNLVSSIWRSREMRAALRPAFPTDTAFEEFGRKMERELAMARTRSTMTGGSPTAEILAEMADTAGQGVGNFAGGMVMGGPAGAAMAAGAQGVATGAQRLYQGMRGLGEGARAEASKRLFAAFDPEMDAFLRRLEAARQSQMRRQAVGQAAARGAGATAGGP